MRRFPVVFSVVVMIAVSGLLAGAAQGEVGARPGDDQPTFRTPDEGEAEFADDRVIVKLEPGKTSQALEDENRENGASTEENIPRLRLNVVELPEELPVEEAVELYEDSPDVEYAEPDFLLKPSATTANDPRYSSLYGLHNAGQTSGANDADIDAPEAWDTTTGGPETVVAVIDEGADTSHPDLKNNLWTNPGETAGNGVDDDNNGFVDDIHGWDFANDDRTLYDPDAVSGAGDEHGTHVAGTIAAEGNNSLGVVGVNWKARIMPLKFLGPDGGYTSDAIEALDYAVKNGAKISNNSWGGGGNSQALLEAIKKAGAAGHLFVAAAGNGGEDGVGDSNDTIPSYPANYDAPNVVSVAATDKYDNLASFSNHGATSVDLAAPGVGILSTLPGGEYGSYSGTSMATPHVTGVTALIKSDDPTLDATGVKKRLLDSVDERAGLTGKTATGGRLNAAGALGVALPDPEPTSLSLSASGQISYGGSASLSGRLVDADGSGVSGQRVVLERRPVGASDFSTLETLTTSSDGSFSASVTPGRNTDYRASFAGDGTAGLLGSVGPTIRVDVRVAVSLSVAATDLKLGYSRTISGKVSPAHPGKTVTLKILRNGVLMTTKSLTLSGSSGYSYSFRPASTGTYTVKVKYAADADHAGAVSPLKTFRVVR